VTELVDAVLVAVFGIGGQFVVGIGALLLGGVVMVAYSRSAAPFFAGRTLARGVAGLEADQPSDGSVDPAAPSSEASAQAEMITEAIPVTVFASTTPAASNAPASNGWVGRQEAPRPWHRLYGLADPRQLDDR
jgi:hypothetical protein